MKPHYFNAENFKSGQTLLFDKPLEWTSFQLVNKVRWLIRHNFKIKKIKVGHAGTLDPLATGLLVVCTGKNTKKINGLMGLEKEYTGVFTLGATTPSYDLETKIDQTFPIFGITEEQIKNATTDFIGEIQQVPPLFSALKKGGKRLYEYARNNETVEIEARKVVVSEFEIVKIEMPEVSFRIKCSKGTYIRSLARDFGEKLGCGAHLSALRRTKIGDFSVDEALNISEFEEKL
jgi:tRNA pseudouridine55 synthase